MSANMKWYAGASHNSQVEIHGDLIYDPERNFRGYRVKDSTTGAFSYAPASDLFDTQKEADEYIFNNQRASNKKTETPSQGRNTTAAGDNKTSPAYFASTADKTKVPFRPGQVPVKPQNHPISGLQSLGITDTLKRMGVYVVDAETTGLKQSDRMFSAAYSKLDMNTGEAEFTNERFFRPNSVKPVNRKNMSDAQVEKEYRRRLEKAHSSEVFGARQAEAGSLDEAAKAMAEGRTVKPETFLNEFSNELSKNNGNVVFTHNSNFENSQFNKLEGIGNSKYDKAYNRLNEKNIGNNSGLFGADKNISNWTSNDDAQGFTQRIRSAHEEYISAVKGKANPSVVREALGKYASANTDNLNYLMNQIRSVEGKAGAYVNIDSMHLIRGLMSYGALHGDVDPGNILLGGKVEHQALAWLKRQETHQAGDDTRVQGKIAQKLIQELEAYGKDPTRKSALLQELNAFINENNIATATFKSSINSEISNTGKYKSKMDYVKGVTDWVDETVDRYSTASGDHSERQAMARQIQTKVDSLVQENPEMKKERLANELEKWMAEAFESPHSPGAVNEGKIKLEAAAASGVDFLKKHKNKLAVAGLALAGTMFMDGSEKGEDKKYNTYDEVYNNQYYGSGFADWQNRNNAHRVLY